MGTQFQNAPEVRRIANKLIGQHHRHLLGLRLEYVFISKTDKDGVQQPIESKGKQTWGRAKKVSGLNAYLARERGDGDEEFEGDDFFVIEISLYAWQRISEEQMLALVDHELCHCALNPDSGTPEIRPHDVEEFSEIVKRHGLWRADVEQMIKIGAEKLPLFAAQEAQQQAAKSTKATKAKTAAPSH